MVPTIPRIHLFLTFFVYVMLICYCGPKIFELFLIFERYVSYPYITILSYILVMRYEYALSFLRVYVQTNLLTTVW
jgi:hypothetical protein